MTRKTMTRKNSGILGSALLLVATSIFAGNTMASTVTVDGIMSAGEYTGTNSGSISLLWYNNHESIYTEAAGNMNPLHWEIYDGGDDNVSLNLFFEVPLYARRMLWQNGCEYNGTLAGSGCSSLAPGGVDTAYLDSYLVGTHHDSVKMGYNTQTSSEFFELHGVDEDGVGDTLKRKWQEEDSDPLSGDFNWSTSREYLIANGDCTTSFCDEFDTSASFEVEWTGLASVSAAGAIRDAITKMELHLSDEARGLPPVSEVPVPAAFWLFGTALIGFIGYSRRTNLS